MVASQRREAFRLASVVEFVPDPLGPDRRSTGRFVHRPVPAALARRLLLAGESVPAAFTVAPDTSTLHVREAS